MMTELVAAPVAAPVPMKVNLLWLDEAELQALLKEWKQPKFRAKQIQDWIFEKGVTDFEQMSNLPAALRALLAEHATVGSMDTQRSPKRARFCAPLRSATLSISCFVTAATRIRATSDT